MPHRNQPRRSVIAPNFAYAPRFAYTPAARRFHWWTVGLLAIQVPLGIGMVMRGSGFGIWDGLTNGSYSAHKLLGVVLFFVVAARLAFRLRNGAPAPEPTTEAWQRRAGHITHGALYALLLTAPVLGWFGVQLYPALDLFGIATLPAIVPPDKAMSAVVLQWHAAAAFTLLGLIALHIAAALFHRLIRKDQVFQRMQPGGPASGPI